MLTLTEHSRPALASRLGAAVAAFRADRSGNTLIVGALALPVVLGVGALTLEYGDGVLARVENPRIADLASYSGAIAYAATSSQAAMTDAARNMAVLNGIVPGSVSVALIDSPRTAGATFRSPR